MAARAKSRTQVRDPAWSGTCPVRPFAAYWGGRPRLAPGMIVGMVSQIGGPEALEDLAVELALKVAELVEHIASDQHLPAADVADILFID
jgi:hypothetical protein